MKNIEKAIAEINEVIKEFNKWAELIEKTQSNENIGEYLSQANSLRRIIYGQIHILNLLDDEHCYRIEYYKHAIHCSKMQELKVE